MEIPENVRNSVKKKSKNYGEIAAQLAVFAAQGLVAGVSSALGSRLINSIGKAPVKIPELEGGSVIALGSKKALG
jgi:hypothetical protein